MLRSFLHFLAISSISVAAALAQPQITIQALNSAAVRGIHTPGSGIAQGSIFTVYGSGLGPDALVGASSFPLQTKLGGSSLKVTAADGTQVDAIILAAVSYQINAILPSNTPTGTGSFTVTYNGETSAPAEIDVVNTAVGVYTFNESGSGQAIATDVNYKLNSIIHTAHPGDWVTFWATGLGAISGSDADLPPVTNLPANITVYVGNTAAKLYYQGRSGCCAGLDQIVFQVPSGTSGCYVPVAIAVGNSPGDVTNVTTIAVSGSGSTCSDSVMGQDLISQLASGKNVNFGYIRLESQFGNFMAASEYNLGEDSAMATFSSYTPGTAGYAQYGVSNGYCIAVDCTYGCFGVNTANFILQDSSPAQLDAGAITLSRSPSATLTQAEGHLGSYSDGDLSQLGRYLWSSLTYPVSATGGAAVGAFNVSDQSSKAGVTFTGLNDLQTISRGSDLALTWTGGDPTLQNGQVTISIFSINSINSTTDNLQAAIQCTAPLSAGQFTIPGRLVNLLPASGSFQVGAIQVPLGFLWIGQYNNPTTFTASGLDKGLITDIFYNGHGAYFK